MDGVRHLGKQDARFGDVSTRPHVEQPNKFLSFAPWESFEAQRDWKELPEFRERLMRVRSHCEDFEPSTLELVAQLA